MGYARVFLVLLFSCVLVAQAGLCSSSAFSYEDALGKAILFFEGQRSGKLPADRRVKWRANSALSDGQPDNVYA